jgi:hypothetical protein
MRQGLHACACPAQIARRTGNSVGNRTRKPPEHSFGPHDGALFNSLLGRFFALLAIISQGGRRLPVDHIGYSTRHAAYFFVGSQPFCRKRAIQNHLSQITWISQHSIRTEPSRIHGVVHHSRESDCDAFGRMSNSWARRIQIPGDGTIDMSSGLPPRTSFSARHPLKAQTPKHSTM